MTYYGSEEHEPVTWWRGHPVYAAHLVTAVFVVSMLATTVLQFAHVIVFPGVIWFDSTSVLHGQIWRIFTYGFWNPPSLWFALEMLMLAWFGREVEKFFGRTKFLVLYTCVYLLPPVLFTALGGWMPTTLAGESSSFALFIAFATLYPGAPIFFTLLAKWVALILIAIYSLSALASHSWESLLNLWSTSAFAFGFVRHQQGHFSLPTLRLPRRRPNLRVVPDLPKKSRPVPEPAQVAAPASASMAEVDALLDKIAQHGIGSLTAKERAKLDAARRELKRKQ